MKTILLNGSPHAEGNTFLALKKAADMLEAQGIETELIHIGGKQISGCVGCGACFKGECAFADDFFRDATEKMYAADGLVLGTPVYYSGIAGGFKCFLDRAFYQSAGRMRGKIGAGIAVCRRSGGMTAFGQLNAYFQISEMPIATSFYWNVAHGAKPGEVLMDAEAVSTIEQMALNMAWLLKMKQETKDKVPLPEKTKKERMNFIR